MVTCASAAAVSRSTERCGFSTRVHLEDVHRVESRPRQDHLLTLHMCYRLDAAGVIQVINSNYGQWTYCIVYEILTHKARKQIVFLPILVWCPTQGTCQNFWIKRERCTSALTCCCMLKSSPFGAALVLNDMLRRGHLQNMKHVRVIERYSVLCCTPMACHTAEDIWLDSVSRIGTVSHVCYEFVCLCVVFFVTVWLS